MNYYTPEQKLFMVKQYYSGNSAEITRDLFAVNYPESNVPSASTIRMTVRRLETTFSLVNIKNKIVPDNNVRDLEIQVCALVELNPTMSSRQIARELEICATTVQKILRKNKYRSYKITSSQVLFPDDYYRRMEFCEIMINKYNNNELFFNNVLFTDEKTFRLHGHHNRGICRYWSRKNQHLNIATRTQYPQKVNVWAGIIGNQIIGPFFIDGNLNGNRYLQLLENNIIPAIRERFNINDVWFQQDGCPAHNTRNVTNFLNRLFRERWIGNAGPVKWPARSPDLAPNDFFLWPFLHNSIYGYGDQRPSNLEELRARIIEISNSVTPDTLINMRRNFYNRLGYCSYQEGGLFEHLINYFFYKFIIV